MRRRLVVFPIAWETRTTRYDGLFVTLGYEERARHVASQDGMNATRRVAWEFRENRVLSFEENDRWFEKSGFERIAEEKGSPVQWIKDVCTHEGSNAEFVRLAIDISSMTRCRMAEWVDAASTCTEEKNLELDFWYSMATFTEPIDEEAPNVAAGPVVPAFAGWATDAGIPTSLILGLGYERDQAIGAVEYIEPAEVVAFDPSGADTQYANAIKDANAQLWSMRPRPPRRISYDPGQVFPTFVALEGLVSGLVRRSRPVLLPFGPKVFTLLALLTARFHPTTAVWRVSAGAAGTPAQRKASGTVVGLRAHFLTSR